jgi:predicted nucleotidyltransferase
LDVSELLSLVTTWAEASPSVLGLALVGSHARGTAGPGSDVDLVIICSDPALLLDGVWIAEIGESGAPIIEDYGALTSLRVQFARGPEVEFGIASPSWVQVPLDAGTREVIAGGCRVLYDPDGLLGTAELECSA